MSRRHVKPLTALALIIVVGAGCAPARGAAATADSSPESQAVCSSSSVPTATMAALAAAYGEVRSCVGVGSTWLVFELGTGTTSGGVDEYACPSPGCVPTTDGIGSASQGSAASTGQWQHYDPPYPGEITLLEVLPDGSVIIDDAGHQLDFDPATGTFAGGS